MVVAEHVQKLTNDQMCWNRVNYMLLLMLWQSCTWIITCCPTEYCGMLRQGSNNCLFLSASASSTVVPLVLAYSYLFCAVIPFYLISNNTCCACVGQILEDKDPQKLSKLQSRLLFMSCQRRVSPAQREGCSGGTFTRMQQEVFHCSTIEGPLERYWLCHVSSLPFSLPL